MSDSLPWISRKSRDDPLVNLLPGLVAVVHNLGPQQRLQVAEKEVVSHLGVHVRLEFCAAGRGPPEVHICGEAAEQVIYLCVRVLQSEPQVEEVPALFPLIERP